MSDLLNVKLVAACPATPPPVAVTATLASKRILARSIRSAAVVGIVLVLAMLLSTGASSGSQNVDLMARWTAATIVNYRVIAEFSGEALLVEADGLTGRGTVTDRFEVEFD